MQLMHIANEHLTHGSLSGWCVSYSVPETVIAEAFEKRRLFSEQQQQSPQAVAAAGARSSSRRSMLTVQLEQMKEQSSNPFSRFAKYDGKVRRNAIVVQCTTF